LYQIVQELTLLGERRDQDILKDEIVVLAIKA
jgi:hypothetical protein